LCLWALDLVLKFFKKDPMPRCIRICALCDNILVCADAWAKFS
jgi:hypothetical protein